MGSVLIPGQLGVAVSFTFKVEYRMHYPRDILLHVIVGFSWAITLVFPGLFLFVCFLFVSGIP